MDKVFVMTRDFEDGAAKITRIEGVYKDIDDADLSLRHELRKVIGDPNTGEVVYRKNKILSYKEIRSEVQTVTFTYQIHEETVYDGN